MSVHGLNIIARLSKGETWCPILESQQSRSEFRAADPIDSEKTTLCINIAWAAEQEELRGLLGYLVVLSEAEAEVCRLIWIPCVDCGGPKSLVGPTSRNLRNCIVSLF